MAPCQQLRPYNAIIQMEKHQNLPLLLAPHIRPPSPAVGYGTRLYPEEPGLNLVNSAEDITKLMAAASAARKAAEIDQLNSAKSLNSIIISTKYSHRVSQKQYCSHCSEVSLDDETERWKYVLFHSHNSSLQYRRSMQLDSKGEYF